jgi:hypothetical protein
MFAKAISLLNLFMKHDTLHTSVYHILLHANFFSLFRYSLFVAIWPLFQFLILYTVGRTPWRVISPSQGRYVHMTTQTQNKSTQTSMPRVRFEPTSPVFELAKTVHALDRAATVIGEHANNQH